jgi:hypothetical protein
MNLDEPPRGTTVSSLLHTIFDLLPVKETCEWYGTEWSGEGKEAKCLPCGEPTVGNGLFCDPHHVRCVVMSVCERHKGNDELYE